MLQFHAVKPRKQTGTSRLLQEFIGATDECVQWFLFLHDTIKSGETRDFHSTMNAPQHRSLQQNISTKWDKNPGCYIVIQNA